MGRSLVRPGAHDAAFAAEHFQQLGAQVAVGELLDRFQHVAAALRGHDLAGQQVFAEIGRLQHAAADGKQAAGGAAGRVEVARLDAAPDRCPPRRTAPAARKT